jgi:uncharacterized OB-fold protein
MQHVKGFSCPKCGWSDVFALDACPRCQSHVEEVWFSGQGKIATFTLIRYPPKGFEGEAPYVVAMIDLEKGPRVMGRIVKGSGSLEIGHIVSFLTTSNGALEFGVKTGAGDAKAG